MYKKYYKNIFLYSSLQSTGNAEKYFQNHTEKLVVFVINPRRQYNTNLIRLYKKGKLVEEKVFILSKNIFMYYVLWYIHYIYFLFSYFSKKEKVTIINFHPISFFGMSLQKMLRNIEFLFWDGDFFPPVNLSLILFEKVKKHYNSKVPYAFYQSDIMNEKMNDKVINTKKRKTVMWGVLPKNIQRKFDKRAFTILFVGVIRDSQGLEFLFDFLQSHKDYSLKILGICTDELYKKYSAVIKKNKIEKQVYFPNRFFSDGELEEISKTCQVGIALYDATPTSATYYTDPGKVKTYAALGLPIVMSNVSAIAPFVQKFGCGILIKDRDKELGQALLEMKKNYTKYLDGLKKFNKYFYYETYYRKAFSFLEKNG